MPRASQLIREKRHESERQRVRGVERFGETGQERRKRDDAGLHSCFYTSFPTAQFIRSGRISSASSMGKSESKETGPTFPPAREVAAIKKRGNAWEERGRGRREGGREKEGNSISVMTGLHFAEGRFLGWKIQRTSFTIRTQ